jgi:hypothetical protein
MGLINAINRATDVQIYSGTGYNTWIKPTGASFVYVVCIGAGGGGGGGSTANSNSAQHSGGAGGGGSNIITASSLGSICSNIAEVHGPIWTTCMIEKWNYFQDFTSKQIVGILSCVTDVKIKSEMDISVPTVEDVFLKARLLELKDLYTFYDLEEGKRNIHTGIRYEDSIQFSIVDEVMKWCDCDTEEKCKVFIQEYLVPKEISIGDFTKAILKIATTVKEMRGLYELEWCRTQTEWLHKLTVIEEMILKYIATNQSLYV